MHKRKEDIQLKRMKERKTGFTFLSVRKVGIRFSDFGSLTFLQKPLKVERKLQVVLHPPLPVFVKQLHHGKCLPCEINQHIQSHNPVILLTEGLWRVYDLTHTNTHSDKPQVIKLRLAG